MQNEKLINRMCNENMFKQSQILQKKNQKPHFSIYDLTYLVFISLGHACIVVLVCFFQKNKNKK